MHEDIEITYDDQHGYIWWFREYPLFTLTKETSELFLRKIEEEDHPL